MTTEDKSARVSVARERERAEPAEDVRLRWSWTEPAVWTDPMLAALEEGVKGGRWHSLISILRRRSGRRGRGRGADHQRWPNVYFAERGLYNLETAHALAVNPL